MRYDPLLKSAPDVVVRDAVELYAIAWAQAATAASRFDDAASALAITHDRAREPVRGVLQSLGRREHERMAALVQRCPQAVDPRRETRGDRHGSPDLVPREELSDLLNSSLSTAYEAWAIAVRSRNRAFVFWSYIAAQCDEPSTKTAAEQMARDALADGNALRSERRLAWRAKRAIAAEEIAPETGGLSSAALIESLLFKQVARWTAALPAGARDELVTAAGYPAVDLTTIDLEFPGAADSETLADICRGAVRYAEQLASIYLDEADRAADHRSLELAQQLASQSIARLARLRRLAAAHLA